MKRLHQYLDHQECHRDRRRKEPLDLLTRTRVSIHPRRPNPQRQVVLVMVLDLPLHPGSSAFPPSFDTFDTVSN